MTLLLRTLFALGNFHPLSSVWAVAFLTALLLFQIVSVPAIILRKNDLADVLWGPAFPLCAFVSLYVTATDFFDTRKILVLILISLWAVRLFAHVGWRNLSHRQEDIRYNNWRKQWGSSWIWRSYLQVFVLQPLILYVFLLPVLFILDAPAQSLGVYGDCGVALWAIGYFFEAVGDEQLRRFKSNPANKGKLMTSGLWSWTRHPNYFGEAVLWWGIWLIAFELPGSWFTVVGPLGVTLLISRVSGVSMLEDLMRTRPGYPEYAKSVSKFFPRPPKHLE